MEKATQGETEAEEKDIEMTVENRQLVTVDELIAFNYRCVNPKCGASLSVPLEAIKSEDDLTYRCPSCEEDWLSKESLDFTALKCLAESLRDVIKSQKANGKKFVFRLEIKSQV